MPSKQLVAALVSTPPSRLERIAVLEKFPGARSCLDASSGMQKFCRCRPYPARGGEGASCCWLRHNLPRSPSRLLIAAQQGASYVLRAAPRPVALPPTDSCEAAGVTWRCGLGAQEEVASGIADGLGLQPAGSPLTDDTGSAAYASRDGSTQFLIQASLRACPPAQGSWRAVSVGGRSSVS